MHGAGMQPTAAETMDTAPSYFLPPFEGPWRIVDVAETPVRIRIEWLQEESLAADWEISLVSVTQLRTRQGPPDPDEALQAGLLPGLTNGAASAQIHEETAEQVLFVCTWSGDFAKSDQTLAVRMRVDGKFLIGIACRMRPPMEGGAASALLERMRAAQVCYDAPQWHALDPAHDERFRPQIEPYLRALDDAMEHDDFAQAMEMIEALRPALELSPLSRFALHVHSAEGWAQMRSAFAGVTAGSARAIEILRRTLDNIEPGVHREVYRAASTWLADAYAKRDQPGDLLHAIEAYRSASRLEDAQAYPERAARLHLRMGIMHHHLARESSAQQTERLELALPELDRAEVLYGAMQNIAGLAEAAIAKADAVRLLGRANRKHDADELYGVAWNLLQQPDAKDAIGSNRYHTMLEHVRTSMRARDARQLNVRAPSPQIGQARAMATFVRPAASRPIAVHPPGDESKLLLEVVLRRALFPDVSIMPVEAAVQAGSKRDSSDQSIPTQLLQQSHIVMLVPGFGLGLQPELQYLIEQGWLSKTLLMMIPASAGLSVQDLWERVRSEAFEVGLDLPPYTAAGALLRPNRDGNVVRRMPFDLIFEPRRLLQALEDLLTPPPADTEADGSQRLTELVHKGLMRRMRARKPKDRP